MSCNSVTVIFLLALPLLCSVLMSQRFNGDFVTGQYKIWPDPGPEVLGDFYFTNPLLYMVSPFSAVYYATGEIYARIYSQNHPGNSSRKNLQYYFEVKNSSQTQLTTKVTAYLQSSQFYYLTYRYIIVLSNNRLFPQFASVERVSFEWNMGGSNSTTALVSLPLSSSSNSSLTILTFLSDVKAEYPISLQTANSNRIEIRTTETMLNSTCLEVNLQVSSYFLSIQSCFRIRYLVVAYDLAGIQTNLPRYQFYSSTLSGSYWSSLSFYPNVDLLNSYSTMLVGLSETIFYNNQPSSFYFRQSYGSTYLYFYIYSNTQQYSVTVWVTAYFQCEGPLLTLNSSDSLCYPTTCPTYTYLHSNGSCLSCSSPCLECYSSTECISCQPGTNRVLETTSCLPATGFYQTNNATADPCTSPCDTCQNTGTNCSSCISPYILTSHSCLLCLQLFEGCQLCNYSSCFTCNSSYRWFNSSYCSILCPSHRCQFCSNDNSSRCLSCLSPYVLKSGSCVDNCGDGFLGQDQECDDGNLWPHDGCDQSCLVEEDYFCPNMTHFLGYNYTAYCAYTGTVTLTFLTLQKLMGENQLRVVAAVDKIEMKFWEDHQDLSPYVNVNSSHRDMQVSFISQWSFSSSNRLLRETNEEEIGGRMMLQNRTGNYSLQQLIQATFIYRQSINSQVVRLTLDFSSSRDLRVSSIPSSSASFLADPNNNHNALLYPDQIYNQQALISNSLLLISMAYLLLYLISLIAGNKRIMAQGIVVAQLALAGVASCERLTPNQAAITQLRSVCNPYDIFSSDSYRPFDDSLLPNRLRGTSLYSSFLSNLNSGLIWPILPLLLGIIIALISLCLQQPTKQKASSISNSLLTDYVLAGLTLIGPIVGCSAVLEFTYGMSASNGMMNLAVCAIVLALISIYGVLWVVSSHRFSEFQETLVKQSNVAVAYQLFYYLFGSLGGAVNFLFYDKKYSTAIVMGASVLLLMIPSLADVFAKTRDKLRVQTNLLCVLFTQLPFLIAQIYSNQSIVPSNIQLLPGLIPLTLALNLLVNTSLLTYLTAKRISLALRARDQSEQIEAEEEKYQSERNEEMKKIINDSLSIPLQAAAPHKFKTRFIEEDEEEEPPNPQDEIFKKELDEYLQHEKQKAQKILEEENEKEKETSAQNMINKGKKRLLKKLKYTCKDYMTHEEYNAIGQP